MNYVITQIKPHMKAENLTTLYDKFGLQIFTDKNELYSNYGAVVVTIATKSFSVMITTENGDVIYDFFMPCQIDYVTLVDTDLYGRFNNAELALGITKSLLKGGRISKILYTRIKRDMYNCVQSLKSMPMSRETFSVRRQLQILNDKLKSELEPVN